MMPAVLAFSLMLTMICQGEPCLKSGLDAELTRETQSALIGTWGGDHIRMDMTKRAAKFEFDCAHGSVNEPILLDKRGRFSLKGSYVMEHGGPVRLGEETKSLTARYVGRVKGRTMRLTVIFNDDVQDSETFTLTRGTAGNVTKCL